MGLTGGRLFCFRIQWLHITSNSERAQKLIKSHIAAFENALESAITALRLQTEQRLAAKYKELNSYTSISRLPNEVLAYIFELIVESCQGGSQPAVSSLKSVNYVSSHFHNIALRSPRLWGYIESTHGKVINGTLLQRSGRAPLHITTCVPRWNPFGSTNDFIEHLSPHIHRFKTFRYYGYAGILRDSNLLAAPAPELETLVLNPSTELSSESVILPAQLFSGETPKLQILHLKKLCYPWDSPFNCPSLSSLRISELSYSTSPSIENLINILSRCFNLEELVLKDAGPLSSLVPSSHPAVWMPRLRKISIHGGEPAATWSLLGAIAVNRSSNVAISIQLSLRAGQTLETPLLPYVHPEKTLLSHLISSSLDTIAVSLSNWGIALSTRCKTRELKISTDSFQTIVSELENIAFPNLQNVYLYSLTTRVLESVAVDLVKRFSTQITRIEIISSSFLDTLLKFMGRQWNLPLLEYIFLLNCRFNVKTLESGVVERTQYYNQASRPKVTTFSLKLKDCSMSHNAFATMSERMVRGGLEWDGESKFSFDRRVLK